MDAIKFYENILKDLKKQGRERSFINIQQKGNYIFDENNKKLLNLQSNDYIGIGARGDFKKEIADAVLNGHINMGSYSSRLLSGNNYVYEELEALMQNKFRRPALLFNSGYHMNTGILPTLVTEKTIIIADKLVHASIIDGLKLCKCKFERFRHNDLNHLDKIIQKNKDIEDIIVVVESIYSMDGDCCNLKDLVNIKRNYPQVRLYVDEAHGIGCRGSSGLGLAEESETIKDIDLLVGTFGKAFASMGGYLISDEITKKYLIQKCRPLIFSTALPPMTMYFNKLVLENLNSYNQERERLKNISTKLKYELSDIGVQTVSRSNIIPIILGSDINAIRMSQRLRQEGFFVLPVRPPSVAEGTSRIRISLTSETTEIDCLVDVIKDELYKIRAIN